MGIDIIFRRPASGVLLCALSLTAAVWADSLADSLAADAYEPSRFYNALEVSFKDGDAVYFDMRGLRMKLDADSLYCANMDVAFSLPLDKVEGLRNLKERVGVELPDQPVEPPFPAEPELPQDPDISTGIDNPLDVESMPLIRYNYGVVTLTRVSDTDAISAFDIEGRRLTVRRDAGEASVDVAPGRAIVLTVNGNAIKIIGK